MGWVRVDDAFYDHGKFQHAGPLGVAQWLAGLAWANRNLSDGFVPVSASRRLLDWDGVAWQMWSNGIFGSGEDAEADKVSEHLVACGLWEEVPGGYMIHDYHDYQPSAEKIKADRAKNAAKQAEWRASQAAASGGSRNESRNSVTNGVVTDAPNPNPNPNPTEEVSENLPQPAAAARAKPRKRRRSKPDLTDMRPLIDALGRAGIQVSWDLSNEQADEVRASLDRCGASALVKAAQRQHQPSNPAFSVKAFVAGWSALPGKPPPLELVPDPCEHGFEHRVKCASCRAAGAA